MGVLLKNWANVIPSGEMRLKLNVCPSNVKFWLDCRLSERLWRPIGPMMGNKLSCLSKVAINLPLEKVSGLPQSPFGLGL